MSASPARLAAPPSLALVARCAPLVRLWPLCLAACGLAACGPASIQVDDSAAPVPDSRADSRADSPAPDSPADTAITTIPPGPVDTAADPDLPDGDLYASPGIYEFALDLDDDAYRSLQRDGGAFVPATLTYADPAGIRYSLTVATHIKGSSSHQPIDDKPSLIIDVNYYDPEQEFLDTKKFYLHNECYDPAQMSSTLSYRFYREQGYPASRTSFAHLTVNGRDYGLYLIVEPHNDDFLQLWFDEPDGNLYENAEAYCDVTDRSCMEVEEFDEGNHDALDRLGDAARASGDAWRPSVEPLLDWPRFIQGLALEAAVVHWDSYSYDLSNYQLYHAPISDQWTLLTQSMDLDYGYRPWSYPDCGQYGMDLSRYNMGMLAAGCQEDASCYAEFLDQLDLYADELERADGAARVRELDALIGDAVRADPRRYWSDAEYETHVACLQTFFDARPQQIRDWVLSQR